MKVKVLKGFPYSTDGITAVSLCEGQEVEIRDDLVKGLLAERYVGEIDVPKVAESPLPPVPEGHKAGSVGDAPEDQHLKPPPQKAQAPAEAPASAQEAPEPTKRSQESPKKK